MGRMNLNQVELGSESSLGGVRKRIHDAADAGLIECCRLGVVLRERNCAGCQDILPAALCCSDLLAALPRASRRGLAACVRQLDTHARALLMAKLIDAL